MRTDRAVGAPNVYGSGGERTRWAFGAAAVLVCLTLVVWLTMRKEYPEVTSPESLTLVRALYTACSSQNPSRLDQVEQLLEKCCQESKVTEAEETAFRKIIARARQDRWKEAAEASYRFAEDQVR